MLGEKIPTVATPTARFYYWALSKGVGRELYRTWRREMAYSLALAAVALVISEWRGETSALDAFLLFFVFFATVLGCVAVYHLFRIPVVLQGEPNAYDDAKLSCGVAGIVVIAALGIGLIIVVSRVSHIASAPQVVVRTIEWTEHSAPSNRTDAKIQTVFEGKPKRILSGGIRALFKCDEPIIHSELVGNDEYPQRIDAYVDGPSNGKTFIYNFPMRAPPLSPENPARIMFWSDSPLHCDIPTVLY